MSFTFDDLRQEVLEATFLGEESFSEQGTFAFADGRQLSARVHVQHRASAAADQQTRDVNETIEVLVGKDPSNTVIGGIDRPQVGMRFYRSPDRDPDRGPFVFTGQVGSRSAHKWRLVFERKRRVAQGRRT